MQKLNYTMQKIQLLNAHSNPSLVIEGIPDKIIVPFLIGMKMKNATVPYTTNYNPLQFRFEGSNAPILETGILKESEEIVKWESISFSDAKSTAVGKGIEIFMPNANPTDGNGSMDIIILYEVF